MYSLRMSFWMVPETWARWTPWRSAAATYSASRIGAVALIVIDVLTSPRGIPANRVSMSTRDEIGTPTRPTSPSASGASESKPIWVGRSKATDRPVWPWERRYRKRSLVSAAVAKPAYWRIVQNRERYIVGWTPRVKGYSPGRPRLVAGSQSPRAPSV